MRRKIEQRIEQTSIPVKDRAIEVGINLNTIFTALVLAGVLWVGTTLESINRTLTQSAIAQALMKKDADLLREDFNRHITDPYSHYKRGKP